MAIAKKQIVKQDMIDFIKAQGMTKSLKRAGQISAKGTKGEAEFIEGVRRMYGAKRLAAATKVAAPKTTTYQTGSSKNLKRTYQTGSGVSQGPKAKASTYQTGSGVSKPTVKKTAPKSKGMSNELKATAGIVGAAGLLIASRGRAAGAAAKLSPRLADSAVGRALSGRALSVSGRANAKAGRPVSQSQYDAMKEAAAKKGIKPRVTGTPAKKAMTVKKKAVIGSGLGATSLSGDTRKKN